MSDLLGKREIIDCALESIPGVVVTDVKGRIAYIDDFYANILGIDRHESIGKMVTEIIPGTRLHIVAETGQAEMAAIFRLKNGETILVNRYPIKKNGTVIGVVAFGTLSKVTDLNTIATIENVQRLSQELNQYKSELHSLRGAKYSLEQIIGTTPNLIKIKELITKVAQTRSTVLITGETGTGKELVAHAIHQLSPRNHQSFVRVNCAAIPNDLLESELFGYEEGAFTGAKKGGKLGKFELANHGTLLLDEIHQMPVCLQSKLLRVIQEKEVEKVGSIIPIGVDVRLIFISNENLLNLVNRGEFREDLYYRINVVPIEVPPLRARLGDIPFLVNHLIKKINKDLGLNILGIDRNVLEVFSAYHWPGNIRELEHLLERAANIALHGKLGPEHFENLVLRMQNGNALLEKDGSSCLAMAREKAEKEAIIQILSQANGNITMASHILKIHRSVLYDKLKKYGIKV